MQRFNIPLRPDEPPVEFWYLPQDLTPEEAQKIANVVLALEAPCLSAARKEK